MLRFFISFFKMSSSTRCIVNFKLSILKMIQFKGKKYSIPRLMHKYDEEVYSFASMML